MPDNNILKEIADFLDLKRLAGAANTHPTDDEESDSETLLDKAKKAIEKERADKILSRRLLSDANDRIERLIEENLELKQEVERLRGRY